MMIMMNKYQVVNQDFLIFFDGEFSEETFNL